MPRDAREITAEDILGLEDFEKIRAEKREENLLRKRFRRLAVGPHVTVYFESWDTMWLQVQEMLRIEKGGEEQLVDADGPTNAHLLGHDAIEDQRQRWREKQAQATRGRHQSEAEALGITVLQQGGHIHLADGGSLFVAVARLVARRGAAPGGDAEGQTWITMVEGAEGFASSPDPHRIDLATELEAADPLAAVSM